MVGIGFAGETKQNMLADGNMMERRTQFDNNPASQNRACERSEPLSPCSELQSRERYRRKQIELPRRSTTTVSRLGQIVEGCCDTGVLRWLSDGIGLEDELICRGKVVGMNLRRKWMEASLRNDSPSKHLIWYMLERSWHACDMEPGQKSRFPVFPETFRPAACAFNMPFICQGKKMTGRSRNTFYVPVLGNVYAGRNHTATCL
jgi:hypothetical protein